MVAADAVCAGLPALFDEASRSLPDARLMGLGVVRDGEAGRAMLAYLDAFGSTVYCPNVADLPEPFRPRESGVRRVDPRDLSANPAGLVESRLLHAGISEEFTLPRRLQQIVTLPIAGGDAPAIL